MRMPLALTLLALGGAAASAQGLTGTYAGMMECGRLPYTNAPLSVQASLTINGAFAEFSRVVLHPQTNAPFGTEAGRGTVRPNGQVSLRTSWSGQRDRISGVYSGRLTASGGTLRGRQTVTYMGQRYPRTCTLTFRR